MERTATKEDIRKSYRKLVLKHHPDKAPPENREEAERTFKVVQGAYEILYDDGKREQYDQYGMSAFTSGGPGMGDAGDMEDMLNAFFGFDFGGPGASFGFSPGRRNSRPQSREEKPLEATLEELYVGKTLKVAATKTIVCSHCKGKGAKPSAKAKQCPSCKGKGKSSNCLVNCRL